MTRTDAVTLAADTIHNPAEPRHFMKIKPVSGRIWISRDGVALAETERALRLLEVGNDLYDPVLYIPVADVCQPLYRKEKSTYCPLNGGASYFGLDPKSDTAEAWAYETPLDFACVLAGHVAFYPTGLKIDEAAS